MSLIGYLRANSGSCRIQTGIVRKPLHPLDVRVAREALSQIRRHSEGRPIVRRTMPQAGICLTGEDAG